MPCQRTGSPQSAARPVSPATGATQSNGIFTWQGTVAKGMQGPGTGGTADNMALRPSIGAADEAMAGRATGRRGPGLVMRRIA